MGGKKRSLAPGPPKSDSREPKKRAEKRAGGTATATGGAAGASPTGEVIDLSALSEDGIDALNASMRKANEFPQGPPDSQKRTNTANATGSAFAGLGGSGLRAPTGQAGAKVSHGTLEEDDIFKSNPSKRSEAGDAAAAAAAAAAALRAAINAAGPSGPTASSKIIFRTTTAPAIAGGGGGGLAAAAGQSGGKVSKEVAKAFWGNLLNNKSGLSAAGNAAAATAARQAAVKAAGPSGAPSRPSSILGPDSSLPSTSKEPEKTKPLFDEVFEKEGNTERLVTLLGSLRAINDAQMPGAVDAFLAGTLPEETLRCMIRSAMEDYVAAPKAIDSRLEVTCFENPGKLDHFVDTTIAALQSEKMEIGWFVGTCPRGKDDLIGHIVDDSRTHKLSKTSHNLHSMMGAAAAGPRRWQRCLAEQSALIDFKDDPFFAIDLDRRPMCATAAAVADCPPMIPVKVEPAADALADYPFALTAAMGLTNVVLVKGNQGCCWAVGRSNLEKHMQGAYGLVPLQYLRPALAGLVHQAYYTPHSLVWRSMLRLPEMQEEFPGFLAPVMSVIFGEDEPTVLERLTERLGQVESLLQWGMPFNAKKYISVVKKRCAVAAGPEGSLAAHATSMGLDPTKREQLDRAAELLAETAVQALAAKRGRDPRNAESLVDVEAELGVQGVMERIEGVSDDPEDNAATAEAWTVWSKRLHVRNIQKHRPGVNVYDPEELEAAVADFAREIAARYCRKNNIEVNEENVANVRRQIGAQGGEARGEGEEAMVAAYFKQREVQMRRFHRLTRDFAVESAQGALHNVKSDLADGAELRKQLGVKPRRTGQNHDEYRRYVATVVCDHVWGTLAELDELVRYMHRQPGEQARRPRRATGELALWITQSVGGTPPRPAAEMNLIRLVHLIVGNRWNLISDIICDYRRLPGVPPGLDIVDARLYALANNIECFPSWRSVISTCYRRVNAPEFIASFFAAIRPELEKRHHPLLLRRVEKFAHRLYANPGSAGDTLNLPKVKKQGGVAATQEAATARAQAICEEMVRQLPLLDPAAREVYPLTAEQAAARDPAAELPDDVGPLALAPTQGKFSDGAIRLVQYLQGIMGPRWASMREIVADWCALADMAGLDHGGDAAKPCQLVLDSGVDYYPQTRVFQGLKSRIK